ncbi:MAG TPA: endopeptidase, partial [Mycobacterium sp.]
MVRVCALVFSNGGLHLAGLRPLLLLLGAMASVTVAVMSLVLNRIKQSGQPKRASSGVGGDDKPPRPPRLRGVAVTIAALISAGTFVVAIWLPPKDSGPLQDLTPQPVLSPLALPAASAIGPGAGIYVEYASGSSGMGCTAGFLVRTSTGQRGFLTAGHCNRHGNPSKVTMILAGG